MGFAGAFDGDCRVLKEKLATYENKCRVVEDNLNGFRCSYESSQQGSQQEKGLVEQLAREKAEMLEVIKRLKCQVATRDEQLSLYSESLTGTGSVSP